MIVNVSLHIACLPPSSISVGVITIEQLIAKTAPFRYQLIIKDNINQRQTEGLMCNNNHQNLNSNFSLFKTTNYNHSVSSNLGILKWKHLLSKRVLGRKCLRKGIIKRLKYTVSQLQTVVL